VNSIYTTTTNRTRSIAGNNPNNYTSYNVNCQRLRARTTNSIIPSSLSTVPNMLDVPLHNSDSINHKVTSELIDDLDMDVTAIGPTNTGNEVGDHLRTCYCDKHIGESVTYPCTRTCNQYFHADCT